MKKMLIIISHLVIKEMQINKHKTIYHYTPITMAKFFLKSKDAEQEKHSDIDGDSAK